MIDKYAKTKTVYQMEATECGAACLCMIFEYFGKHLSLEQMRMETGVNRDGCQAGSLKKAALNFGFVCHGYRKNAKGLLELSVPSIIHWEKDHFVVFEGVKNGKVYINDPALGKRKLSFAEFEQGFSQIVLTFEKSDQFIADSQHCSSFLLIKKYLQPHIKAIAKVTGMNCIWIFSVIAAAVSLQVLIDRRINWQGKGISFLLLFIIVAMIIKEIFAVCKQSELRILKNKLAIWGVYRFLVKLFKLPISFFEQRYTEDLIGRIWDNHDVSRFLTENFIQSCMNIGCSIIYLIILGCYSLIVAIFLLAGVGIGVLTSCILQRILHDETIKLQVNNGKLSNVLYNGFRMITTLKASGREEVYAEQLLDRYETVRVSQLKFNKLQEMIQLFLKNFQNIMKAMIFLIGILLLTQQKVSGGEFCTILIVSRELFKILEATYIAINKEGRWEANLYAVEDVLHSEKDRTFTEKENKLEIAEKLAGEVTLQNICFGYSKWKEPLIKDFSLHIDSGYTAAIIGANGCGKSTIVKLISGLYSPFSGKILLDGKNLYEISPKVLRMSLSVVSQNIYLFYGTVRENLTMCRMGIEDLEIIKACKDACIYEELQEKAGENQNPLDYIILEEGRNFSMGQRQRLEIARALAINPTILIMDEATSALDVKTERSVINHIAQRKCTCIIIAPGENIFKNCEQVFDMESGSGV